MAQFAPWFCVRVRDGVANTRVCVYIITSECACLRRNEEVRANSSARCRRFAVLRNAGGGRASERAFVERVCCALCIHACKSLSARETYINFVMNMEVVLFFP